MKNKFSPLAIISLSIGLFNPILLIAFLFRSSETVQSILVLWLPLAGIIAGILALLHTGAKRWPAVVGIVLNLIPLGFVLLIIWAFSNAEFLPMWK